MTTANTSSFPMHTAAQILVTLTSLVVGFKIGSSFRPAPGVRVQDELKEPSKGVEVSEGDTFEKPEALEDVADGNLTAIQAKHWEPCKLVLVVRTDLKMNPGEISTQCSDATLACYRALKNKNPELVRHWEITGQAKIALKGTSDEQLLELEAIAKSLNLCARAVHNEELTKGREGTRTVLGIGPAPVDLINQVTGKLRLL